ncbi:MAG: thioredoxin fold domain-containing protein [Candidatus Zixiibacteriota bacterium]
MSKNVKKAVPITTLVLFLFSLNVSAQKPAPSKVNPSIINWLKYDQGLKQAGKEKKKIMVFFYTDWCGYCKKMNNSTYKDEETKKILAKNFVSVMVNGESKNSILVDKANITEKELTSRFGVRGFPTIWFLEPNAEKISPLIGYRDAKNFADILSYIAGNWYKTLSFEEYLKKKEQLNKDKK